MQSATVLRSGQDNILIRLEYLIKALCRVSIEVTEVASTIIMITLVVLMWVDLFTTIVVVSLGQPELNPRAALVIQQFGFVGLILYQGLRITTKLEMLYLLSGSESPLVPMAQKVGGLLSPAVGWFLGRVVSFAGWLSRMALAYVWVGDIWFTQYVLLNPIVNAIAIPQVQMTAQVLTRLLVNP